jgi:hypothetical protein
VLAAVPVRSQVPRTAAKCREYCPRDGQRFRGFSPLFADIRGSLTNRDGRIRTGDPLLPKQAVGLLASRRPLQTLAIRGAATGRGAVDGGHLPSPLSSFLAPRATISNVESSSRLTMYCTCSG